ncbi:unnamed protein product [Pedinophyceae sp. YPF-701]|nr:unnamed protein product [Pedinophyceae sp. YPF-701]
MGARRRHAATGASPASEQATSPRPEARAEATVADPFAADERPIVLYDGVCNFCNGGVNLVLDLDRNPRGSVRFAALQSDVGRSLLERCGRSPDDISSIVLVEKSAFYLKSDAVLRIGVALGLPWSAMGNLALLLLPRLVRDPAYDVVAANRYRLLGIRDECRLTDGRYADRFLA